MYILLQMENMFVKGKEKIKLLSKVVECLVLYVPSFPFQSLSIGKLTQTLNCCFIFDSHRVIF